MLSVRPWGNTPPTKLHTATPPPPLICKVSAYVAPMIPLGRVPPDVMAAPVPKLALSVYGRCIGTVMTESVVVESPVQPQNRLPDGIGVSFTRRFSGMKSPARLTAVSEVIDPVPLEDRIDSPARRPLP